MKKFFVIIFLALLCCLSAQPQSLSAGREDVYPDSLTVSLITYYPGDQVYELYGHAGIKVSSADGRGVFYNYGIFDFNAPNFVYRFVKGETDYMVKGYSTDYMLRGYSRRKVVEQVLDLSQEQALNALEYLALNALPQNATYRYNYILDNCSTRPRDIIELATDGTLEYPEMPDTLTFREMMHRYDSNYSWLKFGIDMALGSGLDYVMTYREQMFVPMALMDACAGATFVRDGKRVPLVKETRILNDGSDAGDILPPTPWWQSPAFVFTILFLVVLSFTLCDVRRLKISRWLDSLLYGALSLYGLLLFFLIFVSTHEATSPNWNGVWINPFYLIPAILIWIKSAKKLLYCYHFANFAVLMALLAGWYWIPQVANGAFLPLMLCPLVRSLSYVIIYRKQVNATK